MRIYVSNSGYLCFAFYERSGEAETAMALPEDKATRRRINRVFRAATPEKTLKKALRGLWADEKAGMIVTDGYEYALVLEDYIRKVENSCF